MPSLIEKYRCSVLLSSFTEVPNAVHLCAAKWSINMLKLSDRNMCEEAQPSHLLLMLTNLTGKWVCHWLVCSPSIWLTARGITSLFFHRIFCTHINELYSNTNDHFHSLGGKNVEPPPNFKKCQKHGENKNQSLAFSVLTYLKQRKPGISFELVQKVWGWATEIIAIQYSQYLGDLSNEMHSIQIVF